MSKALTVALAIGAANALPHSRTPTPRAAIASNGTSDNTGLYAELVTLPTAIKRFQRILTDDGQKLLEGAELTQATVWDFNKNTTPAPGTLGGSVSSANIESLPILLGAGMVVNYATVNACGLFVPHVHPRANEFFVVVDGEVDFGYMLETGLLVNGPTPEVSGKLTKYMGTLFPQGSIHYQINNSSDCKSASVLVALNSEDPGTTPVLQAPSAVVNATTIPRQVEGNDIDGLRPVLPPAIVSVIDQCLARCNAA